MRLAALYSGGKDSNYALYLAQQGGHEVKVLVTLFPQEGSWMYHVPNVRWTRLQAQALGLPQVVEEAGEGEAEELEALERALARADVEGLVAGAVASDYQYVRVNDVCESLGLRVHAPLWRKDPHALLREYVDAGLHILIVGVSAEGMDASWLGRRLDAEACEDLAEVHERHGVHPIGEGGEFETLVLDAPNFAFRLEVRRAQKVWEGTSGVLRVEDAALQTKG